MSTAQEEKQQVHDSPEKDFIFLNVQKKKVKILFSEIVYIESQREYIKIVTTQKEYLSKMSTHEIEELLPANRFQRIHRSFIVSVSRIESYTAEMVELNGKQISRLESSQVIIVVCRISRLAKIWETLNQALETLATMRPDWLLAASLPHWYERYGHNQKNINLRVDDNQKHRRATRGFGIGMG